MSAAKGGKKESNESRLNKFVVLWYESRSGLTTILTLDVEVVTVADGGLEEDSNRVGKLGVAFVAKGWKRVVPEGAIADGKIADKSLSVGMVLSLDHVWN